MTYRLTRQIYLAIGAAFGVLLVILPGWWKILAILFLLAAELGMPAGRWESKERNIR